MSRTYKDKPSKFKYEPWDKDMVRGAYKEDGRWHFWTLETKTTKTKKRRTVDTEWRWMGTPSWFVHDFMQVPMRAACRNWEKTVLKCQDLEEIPCCPDYGRKPHVYYW